MRRSTCAVMAAVSSQRTRKSCWSRTRRSDARTASPVTATTIYTCRPALRCSRDWFLAGRAASSGCARTGTLAWGLCPRVGRCGSTWHSSRVRRQMRLSSGSMRRGRRFLQPCPSHCSRAGSRRPASLAALSTSSSGRTAFELEGWLPCNKLELRLPKSWHKGAGARTYGLFTAGVTRQRRGSGPL